MEANSLDFPALRQTLHDLRSYLNAVVTANSVLRLTNAQPELATSIEAIDRNSQAISRLCNAVAEQIKAAQLARAG